MDAFTLLLRLWMFLLHCCGEANVFRAGGGFFIFSRRPPPQRKIDRTARISQRCVPGQTYAARTMQRTISAGWSHPPCRTRGRVAPGQCETVRHGSHENDNAR